jgi:hypothetical protein
MGYRNMMQFILQLKFLIKCNLIAKRIEA